MLFSILKSLGLMTYSIIVLAIMIVGFIFSWMADSPSNGYFITHLVGAFLLAGGSVGICKNADGLCHFLCEFREQPINHIILLVSLYLFTCVLTTIVLTGEDYSSANFNSSFFYVLLHGYPIVEYSTFKWSGAIPALLGTAIAWAIGWGIGLFVGEMVEES